MNEKRVDPKTKQVVFKAWSSLLEQRKKDSAINVKHFSDVEADLGFLKDIDALNALLEPFLQAPTSFIDPPLSVDEIKTHVEGCIRELNNGAKADESYRGFTAAPYPYANLNADFVDSASAFVRLVCNIYDLLRTPGVNRQTTEFDDLLKGPCCDAIDFLIKSRIDDKQGVRWQAISHPGDRYASLFFTNAAALALLRGTQTPQIARWIGAERREQIEMILKSVPKWVISQYNKSARNFYVDAAKAIAPPIGIVYALEILFAIGDQNEEEQKDCCMESLRGLVSKMTEPSHASALQLDFFHSIPLGTSVVFYDDRRYIGAFLSIFAKAKELYPDIIDEDFAHAGQVLMESVREEWIDEATGLWDDGRPLVCFTLDALNGLVSHALYGQVDMVTMPENEMRSALQEALRSDEVLNTLLAHIKAKSQAGGPDLFPKKSHAKEAGK